MAKPLGEKFRKGGRNAAFFPQLSGLARGLDKVIADNSMKAAPTVDSGLSKKQAAEEKRLRKMERNKALAEKQK